MGKRLDLQCLRGVAILEVLLFHFWPKQFMNGYIGVDMFFVLSGFLISMILHRSSLPLLEVFKSFYYSRSKRIFPAYLLFILLTLISLFFIFPQTNIDINIASAYPALFFYTNFLTVDGESRYEAMLSVSDNLFTHTWSLAVEIQFYLMVPFIYLSSRYLGTQKSVVLISLLTVVSLFIYFLADANTSFNYMIARLWQFLAGYMVYFRSHPEKMKLNDKKTELKEVALEEIPHKELSEKTTVESEDTQILIEGTQRVVLIALLVLGFTPRQEHNKDLLRGLTTILTAAFIYLGGKVKNAILNFQPLYYLGDISYILYLIHYPVHVYLHLHLYRSNSAKFVGLACTFILAILAHELFEKFCLKLKNRPILTLVSLLYLGNIIIVIFSSQVEHIVFGQEFDYREVLRNRQAYQIDDLINMNSQLNRQDRPLLRYPKCVYVDGKGPFGVCQTPVNPERSVTAFVIGNSFATNLFRGFYPICQNSFRNITMKTFTGCEVLWNSLEFLPKYDCTGVQERFIKDVESVKPDYLYIISRHIYLTTFREIEHEEMKRRIELVRSTIKSFELNVKRKIFILTSFVWSPDDVVDKINDAMKRKHTTRNLLPPNEPPTIYVIKSEEGRMIIRNATTDCSKCEIMDVNPYFFNKKKEFQYYDDSNGLSYFVNSKHFSSYGIEKIEPMFKEFCTNRL